MFASHSLVEAVGQVAVRAVVGDVGRRTRVAAVAVERPERVVRATRDGPEVGDRQRDAAERDRLAVGDDRRVGKRALGRPLVAEHRAQDLLLDRVVAADHVDARRAVAKTGTSSPRRSSTSPP